MGIQASEKQRSEQALFDLVWQEDGSVCLKASNGKYIVNKKTGHLFANCDAIEDNTRYFFYLINRPILVLKGEQGFVGPALSRPLGGSTECEWRPGEKDPQT